MIDLKKILGSALLVYLLYMLVFSTLPYLFPKKLKEDTKQELDKITFESESEEDSPQRALLIGDTENALNIRMEMLRNAKETIDITYYTIQGGETTDAFLGEILKAADRGVQVRIILDGKLGERGRVVSQSVNQLANHNNINVYLYNPMSYLKPWTLHNIFHDKFTLVDNTYLLLGGRNMGDRYYAPKSYSDSITNDWDVFIYDPAQENNSAITQIKQYFQTLLQADETKPHKIHKGKDSIREYLLNSADELPVSNPQFYKNTLQDYIEKTVPTKKITLIQNPVHIGKKEPTAAYQMFRLASLAEQEVILETPYATANKQIISAFKSVAEQTDFSILTNSLVSSPNVPAFSTYYSQRQKFIDTDATIYEYQSIHSIHGKAMIVDEHLSAIGSLNMDDRSLFINTETMLVIDSEEFNKQLREAIGAYQQESLVVGSDNAYIPSSTIEPLPVATSKKVIIFLASLIFRLFQPLV